MIGAFTEAKFAHIRKLRAELRAALGQVSTTVPCGPEQRAAHHAIGRALHIEEEIADEFDKLEELVDQESAA